MNLAADLKTKNHIQRKLKSYMHNVDANMDGDSEPTALAA